MCNISREIKKTEKIKKSKNVSDDDEEDFKNNFCLCCLGAYSGSTSREM
jgi:hypothetical protein